MATTSLWPIKKTINNTIEYVENKDKTQIPISDLSNIIDYASNKNKTEEQFYVTGINCDSNNVYQDMMLVKKAYNKIDNIHFECKKANEIVSIEADTVVVDPPRSGLDKNTGNILLSNNINKIIYVSCNPITLARDLNVLKDKYELKDMTLFDMFPNTRHVETVCVLERKN